MYPHPFDLAPIARQVWDSKYRLKAADGTALEADVDATWLRVARAAAGAEKGGVRARKRWTGEFFEALSTFELLPAGRIIAGAGTQRRVTLFNCFVMGPIEDDLDSIFENVREAALTMQQGGGIGHDFSTLRPQGAPVRSTGSDASGPVSFMDVWDAMCRTIMSSGARRGAMMGTMRCDHPDIERFIDAKSSGDRLRNFNLSVLVSDAFVEAVRADRDWPLSFGGRVWRTVSARALWDRLMQSTFECAEPGVIFIDRINQRNNLAYCEEIRATNPCGEQPLPAYGACLLGSINLVRLVSDPFTAKARIDTARLEALTRLAVRFLDNCIDVSGYPLAAQKREARAKRRIGLGVTGLADALIMLGQRYGSRAAVASAEGWMAVIQRAAYLASAELAAEKGSFPLFDRDKFLAGPQVRELPAEVRKAISADGMRNGCLTSIAPTGTISLFAGNVSSGVEPVFDLDAIRRVRRPDGGTDEHRVEDFAFALYRRLQDGSKAGAAGGGGPSAGIPATVVPSAGHPTATPTSLHAAFVTTGELSPREHLDMQAALQRHVDSSISKTVNCPADIAFDEFKGIYLEAYDLGLKGCTTFRPNAVTGSVLTSTQPARSAVETAAVAASPAQPVARMRLPDTGRGAEAALASRSSANVAIPSSALQAGGEPSVVYMAKPLERDPALSGFTYKLAWPGSDHAIYVTINDIEREGRRRPFEIFINTRNLEHYAWTVALTRMISAVFRRGGDVSFVVEELKAIFDPQGGHWIGGRYVPSLLAAIGEIIEGHLSRIGLLQPGAANRQTGDEGGPSSLDAIGERISTGGAGSIPSTGTNSAKVSSRRPAACPRCERPDLVREEGCWVCRSCGYSRCG